MFLQIQCLFPEYLVKDIETPLFLLNSLYDSWQVRFFSLVEQRFCSVISLLLTLLLRLHLLNHITRYKEFNIKLEWTIVGP